VVSNRDRTAQLDEAYQASIDRAVEAGADPKRVEIANVDETPLSYMTPPASRLRVRAVGPMA
jgi:hypothetical protein